MSGFRWRRLAWAWLGFAVAIALFGSRPLPGFAQAIPETAPVVIDGRTLFEVAATGDLTALERAEYVNSILDEAIDAESPPELNLASEGKTPVIRINVNPNGNLNDVPNDALNDVADDDPNDNNDNPDDILVSITIQDLRAAKASALDAPDLNLRVLAYEWFVKLRNGIERAREERRPAFLRRAVITAVVVSVCAIALHWFFGFLWRRYLRQLLRRITLSDPASDEAIASEFKLLLSGSLSLVRLALWGSAIFYIINLFPLTRQWGYVIGNILLNTFVASNFSLGDRSFSVLDLLVLVALIIALILLTSTVINLLRSRFLTIAGINRGAQEAVAIIIRYSLISIGTIVILQVWGLDLSSLALLASALSVGIGLGLQNIARDFGSGLVLIFERPIQVGEFVEFGEFMGTVERIGPRSTEIKTLDQVSIIVPNSRFLDQEVINWSHRNPVSRIRIPVGVAYGSDPDQVRKVLLEAGRKHVKVLSTPAPVVLFSGFGDSALEFQLLVWIAEPGKQLIIRSDLYFAIETKLKEHDIEIPFPQRDLHVRSGTLPVELPPELKTLLTQWAQQNQNGQSSS